MLKEKLNKSSRLEDGKWKMRETNKTLPCGWGETRPLQFGVHLNSLRPQTRGTALCIHTRRKRDFPTRKISSKLKRELFPLLPPIPNLDLLSLPSAPRAGRDPRPRRREGGFRAASAAARSPAAAAQAPARPGSGAAPRAGRRRGVSSPRGPTARLPPPAQPLLRSTAEPAGRGRKVQRRVPRPGRGEEEQAGGRGWRRGARARRTRSPPLPARLAAATKDPRPGRLPSDHRRRARGLCPQGCITWSQRVKRSCQPQVHGWVP